jgi:hypothetical protein
MANITIPIFKSPGMRRGPHNASFPIRNGDTVTFTNGAGTSTRIMLSAALMGRFEPPPDSALIHLGLDESVTLQVANAAPGIYPAQLLAPESPIKTPIAPESEEPATLLVMGLRDATIPPASPIIFEEGLS